MSWPGLKVFWPVAEKLTGAIRSHLNRLVQGLLGWAWAGPACVNMFHIIIGATSEHSPCQAYTSRKDSGDMVMIRPVD